MCSSTSTWKYSSAVFLSDGWALNFLGICKEESAHRSSILWEREKQPAGRDRDHKTTMSEAFRRDAGPSSWLLVSIFFSVTRMDRGVTEVTIHRIFLPLQVEVLFLLFYAVADLFRSCLITSMSSFFSFVNSFSFHLQCPASACQRSGPSVWMPLALGCNEYGFWSGKNRETAAIHCIWTALFLFTVNIHFTEPITFPHKLPIQNCLSIQRKRQSRFITKKCSTEV